MCILLIVISKLDILTLNRENHRSERITDLLETANEDGINLILGDLNTIDETETVPDYYDLCPIDKLNVLTFDCDKNNFAKPHKKSYRFDRIYCNKKISIEYDVMTDVEMSDHYPVRWMIIDLEQPMSINNIQ